MSKVHSEYSRDARKSRNATLATENQGQRREIKRSFVYRGTNRAVPGRIKQNYRPRIQQYRQLRAFPDANRDAKPTGRFLSTHPEHQATLLVIFSHLNRADPHGSALSLFV